MLEGKENQGFTSQSKKTLVQKLVKIAVVTIFNQLYYRHTFLINFDDELFFT